MKSTILGLLLAASVALPALAQTAQDEEAVARARADHATAVKSHDQAAIDRSNEALRAAYDNAYNDRKAAAAEAGAPPAGDTKASFDEVERARLAYQHAVASGDKAQIAKAKKEEQVAFDHDWEVRHPKHAGAAH